MGISERTAKLLWWPVIEPLFLWLRFHYGFDLKGALDGVTAIRGSQVAVLLIQGSADRLPVAERLRDANPQHTDLFVVPGVDHDWFNLDRPEVMTRTLAGFDGHAGS